MFVIKLKALRLIIMIFCLICLNISNGQECPKSGDPCIYDNFCCPPLSELPLRLLIHILLIFLILKY